MRTALVVLFDDVQSLDVTGPVEVFSCAGRHHPGTYRIRRPPWKAPRPQPPAAPHARPGPRPG